MTASTTASENSEGKSVSGKTATARTVGKNCSREKKRGIGNDDPRKLPDISLKQLKKPQHVGDILFNFVLAASCYMSDILTSPFIISKVYIFALQLSTN